MKGQKFTETAGYLKDSNSIPLPLKYLWKGVYSSLQLLLIFFLFFREGSSLEDFLQEAITLEGTSGSGPGVKLELSDGDDFDDIDDFIPDEDDDEDDQDWEDRGAN